MVGQREDARGVNGPSLLPASLGFCHWGPTGSGMSPSTLPCLSFPTIKNRHKYFLPWGDLSIFAIVVLSDFHRLHHQKGIKSFFFSLKGGIGKNLQVLSVNI